MTSPSVRPRTEVKAASQSCPEKNQSSFVGNVLTIGSIIAYSPPGATSVTLVHTAGNRGAACWNGSPNPPVTVTQSLCLNSDDHKNLSDSVMPMPVLMASY